MVRLVALAASPRPSSRSRALLDIAVERLRSQGADIQYFHLSIFPAADLLTLNEDSDALKAWMTPCEVAILALSLSVRCS